jgi:hypothetical protein
MTRLILSACWAAGLLGCGAAAVPQERLTSAQAAIKGAEVAGAAQDPKASLHLKLAKEQVAKAEALIAEDDNEQAASLIDRAQADADLALVLAQEAKSRQEAMDVKEQIEEVKRRMAQ